MDVELEKMLRPVEIDMPEYPAKVITLATGGDGCTSSNTQGCANYHEGSQTYDKDRAGFL